MKMHWIVILALIISSCTHDMSYGPQLDEAVKTAREKQQLDDDVALAKAAAEKEARISEFKAREPVIIHSLDDLVTRPLSRQAAIESSIEVFERTGKIDPILTADNTLLFAYGISKPKMACATLRVCSIELEPGEKVFDMVTGDAERWHLSTTHSGGSARGEKPHIMVKPTHPGIATNLIVTTDRRVYNIQLRSVGRGQITPRIAFYYPSNVTGNYVASKGNKDVKNQQSSVISATGVSVDNLNFGYKIKGSKRWGWYPERVFDDGNKVFIQMPKDVKSKEAPVFLAVNESGQQEIVNYRFHTPFYIVDRLFQEGNLILGTNKNHKVIKIIKQN